MKQLYQKIGIILIGVFLLSGCNSRQLPVSEESHAGETKIVITKEQEELLTRISINEDRVKEGNLTEWQKEVLRQYDFSMAYLQKKYPSHSFKITDCDPKTKLNLHATFWFQADGADLYYELYLYIEGEKETKSYQCEDNFYGSLIEPKYAEVFHKLIQESVPECLGVDVMMGTVQGEEFGENFDVQEIIDGKTQITNDIIIFVDNTERSETKAEELYQQIHSLITEKKIYGYYIVIALTTLPEEYEDGAQLWEFVKEKGEDVYSLRESFSQWD